LIVPVNILCPACKAKNHPNRLRKELGNDTLFCVDPKNGKTLHSFPDSDSVDSYDPTLEFLEAESATDEPEPPPTPKPEPARAVAPPVAQETPVQEDPASIRELDPVPVAAAPATLAELIQQDAKPEVPNLFNTTPPQPKVVKFNPPPARKAPGGVLILTARIPDQYIGPLQVQAVEHLKTTIESYFQECVERACENGWWF
jgi:hypothetical protein